MWSNARTALCDYFIVDVYRGIQGVRQFLMRRDDHVVGNSYSVIAALVGWVLWRLRHHQPDPSTARSSGGGSGTQSF